MLEERASCAILAGGKSSRMGRDKALLPFGDYSTLLQFQYEKFAQIFDETYISIKQKKLDFDAQIIHDSSDISAPIVAIIDILKTTKKPRVFVLAVDVPFFGVLQAQKLLEIDADIVMAKSTSGVHPLAAVYSKNMLSEFENAFNNSEYSLQKIAFRNNAKTVEFDEKYLQNLNYIDEYNLALKESV